MVFQLIKSTSQDFVASVISMLSPVTFSLIFTTLNEKLLKNQLSTSFMGNEFSNYHIVYQAKKTPNKYHLLPSQVVLQKGPV